jgi:O-antigen/teichoic acid export membrane protein
MSTSSAFWRYFFNTSWSIASPAFGALIGLFVGVLIARHLGPAGTGLLSFYASLVGLFYGLADLGLDNIATRELVSRRTDAAIILGTSLAVRLASGLVVALGICIAFAHVHDTPVARWLLIFTSASLVLRASAVFMWHFHALVQARYIAFAQFVRIGFGAFASLLLLGLGASVIWFGLLGLATAAVEAFGLAYLYKRTGNDPARLRVRNQEARRLLRDAWPYIFSGTAAMLYMKADQVMIGMMMDAEAVGLYAVAVRLSESWTFVPLAVTASVLPAIIRIYHTEDSRTAARTQFLYDTMALMTVTGAALLTWSSGPLVLLLYGQAFEQSSDVLAISAWSAVFIAMGSANSRILLAQNKQAQQLARTILGAIVNIGLNAILIPVAGIQGAAWATVIAYAVAAYATVPLYPGQVTQFRMMTSSLLVLPAIFRLTRAAIRFRQSAEL